MARIHINRKNATKLINILSEVSPANAVDELITSLKYAQQLDEFYLDALLERLEQLPRNK